MSSNEPIIIARLRIISGVLGIENVNLYIEKERITTKVNNLIGVIECIGFSLFKSSLIKIVFKRYLYNNTIANNF